MKSLPPAEDAEEEEEEEDAPPRDWYHPSSLKQIPFPGVVQALSKNPWTRLATDFP